MSLAEVTYCLNSTSNGPERSPSLAVKFTKQQLAQRLAVLCVSLIWLSLTICIYEGLIPFSFFGFRTGAWAAFLAGSGLMIVASRKGVGDRVVQFTVMLVALLNGAYWYFAALGTFGTSAVGTLSVLGYGLLPGFAVLMSIGRAFHDGSPSVSLGASLVLLGLSMGNVYLLAVAYAAV